MLELAGKFISNHLASGEKHVVKAEKNAYQSNE